MRLKFALCCLATLAGCATVTPPTHPFDPPGAAYPIAVIALPYAPGGSFRGPTQGETRALGAVKGAGVGALFGGVMVGIGAIVFPPLGVPLGLALTPYFTAGGAIAGYARAPTVGPEVATGVPEEQRPILDRMLNGVLADLRLSELAAQSVARNVATFTPFRAEVIDGGGPSSGVDAPDYRSLRDRGFGGAIEIGITHLGFTGWGGDGMSLFVTAEARLFEIEAGGAAWLRGVVYESPTRSFSHWMREDAALTRLELERAYRSLAERVVDVFVLSTEPSGSSGRGGSDSCGVALLDPEPALELGTQRRERLVVPPVDTLTPTLAWSALPLTPRVADPNPWARAGDLRYDLRIWKAVDDAPGDIVYERLGLTGTRHQVEVALEPAAAYFWSVRMRGAIDGRLRAVPWSQSRMPPVFSKPFLREARFDSFTKGGTSKQHSCGSDSWDPCGCLDYIPAENGYRFRTP
jgi:hypothetical protein